MKVLVYHVDKLTISKYDNEWYIYFKQQLGWEDLFGKRVEICGTITHRQMGDNDYGEPWTELNLEVKFIFIRLFFVNDRKLTLFLSFCFYLFVFLVRILK